MLRRLKVPIIIIGKIALSLSILGLIGNCLYVKITHSMVSNVEKNNGTDENIHRIQIDNENGSLVGYVRSPDFSKKRKTIIYLPSSGEIAYNAVLEHGNQFADYVFACVDFPGAQESVGKMNEDSILNTGIQLYDYLMQQDYVDTNNICIMGYSYSTGIVTYLASQRVCRKLVLVAPYRDSADMYNRYTPIYYGPMRFFIKENFTTCEYAQNVQVDTLLITSLKDKTLNKKSAYSLQKDFPYAEVREYNDISHDGYFNNEDMINDIVTFLN